MAAVVTLYPLLFAPSPFGHLGARLHQVFTLAFSASQLSHAINIRGIDTYTFLFEILYM